MSWCKLFRFYFFIFYIFDESIWNWNLFLFLFLTINHPHPPPKKNAFSPQSLPFHFFFYLPKSFPLETQAFCILVVATPRMKMTGCAAGKRLWRAVSLCPKVAADVSEGPAGAGEAHPTGDCQQQWAATHAVYQRRLPVPSGAHATAQRGETQQGASLSLSRSLSLALSLSVDCSSFKQVGEEGGSWLFQPPNPP